MTASRIIRFELVIGVASPVKLRLLNLKGRMVAKTELRPGKATWTLASNPGMGVFMLQGEGERTAFRQVLTGW
ncbi:MAG: hypothetical protein JW913_12440 [Chitinispirillaceae bacterium]|nr:hypothetical protein [Chitinispirillaceae bacterium]